MKSINERYAEAYEAVEFNRFLDERRERRRDAQAEFSERIEAEQKKRQPRRRVNFDPLSDEWIAALRDELLVKYNCEDDDATAKRMREGREVLLEGLAPHVEFIGEPLRWWKVDSSSTSTYRSQGYGMHGYAKAALKPMREWLRHLGLVAEIRWRMRFKGTGPYNCGDGGDYELWANCPEWMADAAKRQLTFDFASKAMGRTVNPQVFNPFLPHEMVDRHYAQAGAGAE